MPHSGSPGVEDAADRAHPRVTYRFHAAALPGAALWVERMRYEARVSSAYEATVWLIAEAEVEPTKLLGTGCTLEVRRGAEVAPIHGIVARVERAARPEGAALVVTLVPALRALGLGSDCRIFAAMSVPEVVEAVLGRGLGAFERGFDKRLRRDYPVREYVVQYRESDLAFVERLLAEEGIWYHFEQPRGLPGEVAELLCLIDDNREAPDAALGSHGASLPLERAHDGLAHHEAVTEFVQSEALASRAVRVRAFNWTHPHVWAEAVVGGSADATAVYVPDEVCFNEYAEGRYARSDAEERARNAAEHANARSSAARGAGNVIGLAPGHRVAVHDGEGGAWIVTSVTATGRDAASLARDVQHLDDFACTFTCARADRPLRPAPMAKPRVLGVQTGRVVGADGRAEVEPGADDVHVDVHGRIRVKLSWDRTEPGAPDATVTCFLRVAQPWAGSGFGVSFTPRVGMEVLVAFVDGDPDRPLVTGCVYNGLNPPPSALPEHKAESGIRTRSTPHGEGYNALRFDDASGRERVTLRAERDHYEEIGHVQDVRVGGERRVAIGGHDSACVAGDRSLAVQGAERIAVTQRAEARYDGGRIASVATLDQLRVTNGDKDDHVDGTYRMTAGRELGLMQGKSHLVMNERVLHATAAGVLKLANAGFSLEAEPEGWATIKVARGLVIEVGAARIELSEDGSIDVSGTQCVLQGAASALHLAADAAALSGPVAKVAGQVQTDITAPLVKLN